MVQMKRERLPVRLDAFCVDSIWAGGRLKGQYHKCTDLPKVAETWELSCHPRGQSVIRDGAYAGRTLSEYLEEEGREAAGTLWKDERFPLLIKLIDSDRPLSLQVHPDDTYGWRVEGEPGKTEVWYVLGTEPGAEMICGFSEDLTREEIAQAIADGTILEKVRHIPAARGDVFFVRAGTIHGIGAGITVAEIQENSDITYRIHDYGRVGADGKPRQLHIAQALDVLDGRAQPVEKRPRGETVQIPGGTRTGIVSCEYFTVWHYASQESIGLCTGEDSFAALTVIGGEGEITCEERTLPVQTGDTVFVPAGIKNYQWKGKAEFLLTTLRTDWRTT